MTSIEPINIDFNINNSLDKNNSNKHTLPMIGITAITIAGCTLLCFKMSIKSLAEILKNQGAELKDGFAVISKTGEKFSGTIKRRSGTYGQKRETIKYENGLITEKIYHNIYGKELEGEFYKSGVLRIKVRQGKNYSITQFDSDGKCQALFDCIKVKNKSKFDNARELINRI